MIRVIIVDDDIDAASALKRNIDGQEGINVVGIFCNGMLAVTNSLELNPDIILMDVRMPIMDGIEASRLIKQKKPYIKILILTLFSEKENILRVIKTNCDGFLFKGHKSDEIIAIIKSTCRGLNTFENEVQTVFLDHFSSFINNNNFEDIDIKGLELITEREQDIVRLITAGKKDSEIAAELFISEGYLRNKLVEIRDKLGLRNSKELAVWGARMGL